VTGPCRPTVIPVTAPSGARSTLGRVTDAPPPWPPGGPDPEPSPDHDLDDDGPDDLALDDALDELNRWVADAQVDQAVAQRRRTAWLRRQAGEDATLAGVLRELGERGRPVMVHTLTGRRHRGLIATVGDDVMVLETVGGSRVIIVLDAIISVRAHGEGTPVTDEGTAVPGHPTGGATLASSLAGLAVERSPVVVTARNGDTTTGAVVAVGRDMLTLHLEGDGLAYVGFASVVEVAALESG
jgi:hypothetical protein